MSKHLLRNLWDKCSSCVWNHLLRNYIRICLVFHIYIYIRRNSSWVFLMRRINSSFSPTAWFSRISIWPHMLLVCLQFLLNICGGNMYIKFGATGNPVLEFWWRFLPFLTFIGFCLIHIDEANVMYIPWDRPLVLHVANLLTASIVGRRVTSFASS